MRHVEDQQCSLGAAIVAVAWAALGTAMTDLRVMLRNDSCPAVSQICSLTRLLSPRSTTRAPNSTPICILSRASRKGRTVGSESFRKRPSVSWTRIDDLRDQVGRAQIDALAAACVRSAPARARQLTGLPDDDLGRSVLHTGATAA